MHKDSSLKMSSDGCVQLHDGHKSKVYDSACISTVHRFISFIQLAFALLLVCSVAVVTRTHLFKCVRVCRSTQDEAPLLLSNPVSFDRERSGAEAE